MDPLLLPNLHEWPHGLLPLIPLLYYARHHFTTLIDIDELDLELRALLA